MGKGGVDPVLPTGQVMPHLMCQQNEEEREAEGDTVPDRYRVLEQIHKRRYLALVDCAETGVEYYAAQERRDD